jgi:hypothetical protein
VSRNADLLIQIQAWSRATGGWKAFDSSTGFRLPDNSVLSPDLVLELASNSGASPSDEGDRLGWLLIPAEQAVELEEIWPG